MSTTSQITPEILHLLASQRDPESFVAGGVPINRTGPRISADIDIFHDRQERVAEMAIQDAKTLTDDGYEIRWQRQQPAIYAATVRKGNDETKLEWVADSDFRFFPAVKDDEFGYVLHMADLAVNKVMAAAGRREARDLVDLVTLHATFLPLGAIVWAAVEAAPGFTPEGIIAEIRRNSCQPAQAFQELEADPPIDAADIMRKLRAALDDADRFVAAMPSDRAGILFLDAAGPVQPDPARLADTTEHRGQRRGHWPTSPEIARAMMERHASGKTGQ